MDLTGNRMKLMELTRSLLQLICISQNIEGGPANCPFIQLFADGTHSCDQMKPPNLGPKNPMLSQGFLKYGTAVV